MSTSSLVTEKMRVVNAYSFLSNIGDAIGENTLYVSIGKTDEWSANEGDPGFEVPEPIDTDTNLAQVWEDLVGIQKVEKYDVRPVIPRLDWGDPAVEDSLTFSVGDVVAVNTIVENQHPLHPAGIQVYQCVGVPETGTCSIDPGNNTTEEDCNLVGGTWTPTPSAGNIENIPRTQETGFDSGDGYFWDFLYSIPQDVEASYVNDNWLIVPTQEEVTDERSRWSITDEVNIGDNRIMMRVNAYYMQVAARISGSAFGEIGFVGQSFRQISLINNPLLNNNSTENPIQKATDEVYASSSILPDSGDIMYIENRLPVTRDIDQIEELRIIIQF